ncbi:(deoxy)nucleoside triphosphate pyrophosphohydrolase [Sporosarcina gallistercoris]|uniref:8-oxo-dGTP diphosphatase n=1 Tax=Sporosarcina gallistercoris TaxID=2762245 RepID=A0ABR8PK17_9BACL|nr:(deoxy)nucleoside triphosphate pyrophosphohydrolase [Sporosarcina gallistercoris]MBD7908517.1 (deoxy)nucleoside triphosphate pyrophosphohydrolase [Sporosarcina gallistercoris]
MKKKIHVVGAIIENENAEILAALRSPEMTLPDYWEFPGGKIEPGESKTEALQREILEELGCSIKVLEQVEDTTYEYENFIVRLETFMAKVTEGVPKLSEHAELKWVSRSKLATLKWAPADIPAIEALLTSTLEK